MHHLDAPWKPAEVEQREGRILRQGNENSRVAIYRYVTAQSFDAFMWQALETKARFIGQVVTGDSAVRKAEDVGSQELSYAEVKAIASGNPAVLTLAEADADLQRLAVLKKNHADEQYLARRNVRDLPGVVERLGRRSADVESDIETAERVGDEVVLSDRAFGRDDALEPLLRLAERLPERVSEPRPVPFGVYRGLRFGMVLHPNAAPDVYCEGRTRLCGRVARDAGPRAILNALDRLVASYPDERDAAARDRLVAEGQLRDYQSRLGSPFPHDAHLVELTRLRDALRDALSGRVPEVGAEPVPDSDEVAGRIKALKAAQVIDASAERTERSGPPAEEPITIRIRKRTASPAPPDGVRR